MRTLFLTAILASSPSILHAAITDGLVAHYKFDDTTGLIATDTRRISTGRGTLTNFSATPWVDGKIGGAVEADGLDDWITLTNAITNGTSTMSFSGWVWADSRPTWASIAKNWGDAVGQFHFGLNAGDGRLSNFLTNGTSVIDPSVFPIASWQHVAFTYDGVTHRLYRNGAQVTSLTTTTTLVRSSSIVSFGCKTTTAGTAPSVGAPGFWHGKFDDFGFWNRSLSAEEVMRIYNAGSLGVTIGGTPPPTIVRFTASPVNVPLGGTTTLAWLVDDSETLTLNGGPFASQDVTGLNGVATGVLTADTTFTLTAANSVGSINVARLVGVGATLLDPVINEFLAANDTGLPDAIIDGDHEDWIEIHNPNALYSLDLVGYHLTDEPDNLDKWTFPSVTLPPGGYLVVFASEKNRTMPGQPLHTNFKLSENGEYLALVMPNGRTVAQQFSPTFPDQSSDISYSTGGFLEMPTPGAANSPLSGPSITPVTENPTPPLDAEDLTITATVTPQAGASVSSVTLIYRVMYGTEVSIPMVADVTGMYSAIIPESAATLGQMIRWRLAATDSADRNSRAPLFRHPTNSPEYFGTVVRDPAISSRLPIIQRFVQTASRIDGDPGTRCSIFFDGEFFDNLGIRIRGNTSRGWPKKSHKIEMNSGHRFRFKSGVPRVTEFDLNTTYTDKSYIRSQLVSEMQLEIGMVSPEIFPVQVRQNGLFYSVALFTENPDPDMLKRRGIDPDGAYYKAPASNTYSSSSTFEKKTRLYEPGKTDLNALIAGIGLTGTNLETYVFDNIDLAGMANYIATTCITQNIDASDKNHFAYRDTNGTGEWVMLPWDLDLTFGPNALNTDTIVYNQNYASHPFIGATPYLLSAGKNNRFLEAIIKTPRARDMVTRRIRSLIDQFLTVGWFQNRMDQLIPLLDPDVILDHAKWGASSHFGGAGQTLLAANNRIKTLYLQPRLTWLNSGGTVAIPVSQPVAPQINFGTYDANPSSNNQDQEFIELVNPNAFSVDVSGWTINGGITHTIKSGTIMLPDSSLFLTPSPPAFRARTMDPRGGQRLFVQGNGNAHLSNFGETLVLKTPDGTAMATLTIPPAASDPQRFLVISEIMYHPEPDGEAEFIELMNINPTLILELAGVRFSAGVAFTFREGMTLAPLARTLVVKSIAAFESVHGGGKPIAGEFTGLSSLSNGGERIKLDDATGSTIRDFTYDDIAPWPSGADGTGSLILIAPLTNPDHRFVQNWRTSMTNSGNPGTNDSVEFIGSPHTDDNNNGWNNVVEYALGSAPVLSPSMTADGLTFTIQRIPNADDAILSGEASSALTAWTAADLIDATATSQTFRIPPALSTMGRVFIRASVKLR